jgi:tetratricopeptide (TPR) repeat protein
LSDHLTSSEVSDLARGTLSQAGRRRLVMHMVHGCAQCSQLLAPALALPPGLLEKVNPGLLGQSESSANDRNLVPAGEVAPDDAIRGYDGPVSRAFAEAMRCQRTLDRERRRSSEAQVSPTLRERVLDVGSLRGLVRVEMLLAASWDLRDSDPDEMVRVAELALFAAERLDAASYAYPVIADVRARTWAELANAYRVAEDIVGAERAMSEAESWRQRGSGDPWLVARIADLIASLRSDQGRFSEARELLAKVHQFYRRVGDHHLAGRALISRGIFAGYDNEPRQALALLCEGLDFVDLRQDPILAMRAVHAILWNLVTCGRFRQAQILLRRSRTLLSQDSSPVFLLRVCWLEGRIHAGLGDIERAEIALQATRRGFDELGSIFHAALASLDLAVLWLQQRKTRQVRQLVDEMITVFRAKRVALDAVAALLILRATCDHDAATADRIRAVVVLLSDLERQPRRRHEPAAENPTKRTTAD